MRCTLVIVGEFRRDGGNRTDSQKHILTPSRIMNQTHFLRLLTLTATVINVAVGACNLCLINATVNRRNSFRFNHNHSGRDDSINTGRARQRNGISSVVQSSALPIGIMGSPSIRKLEWIDSSVIVYLLLRKLMSISFGSRVCNRSLSVMPVPLTKNRNKWRRGFFIDEASEDPNEKAVDIPVGGKGGEEENFMTSSMITAIRFYKQWISPILPPACRFLPTCSQYGVQAIKEYGPTKGALLTAWRLARCSPFGGRGYDPPRWPPVAYNYGSY